MVNWKFRFADVSDARALRAFEEVVFTHAVDVFNPAQFHYLLQSSTCRVLVYSASDSSIIQAACIGLLRHFSQPSGRIYKIGVHPDCQGKGLGGAILRAMEQIFRREGMSKSCAEARVSNLTSQAMFTRFGYTVSSILPKYYADGEDGVKLWKSFSPRR